MALPRLRAAAVGCAHGLVGGGSGIGVWNWGRLAGFSRIGNLGVLNGIGVG